MHPQYELDHINAVFHQNYRDAHLDHQLRIARRVRSHRIKAIATNARAWTGVMMIAVGDKIRPQPLSESGSVTGGEVEPSRL